MRRSNLVAFSSSKFVKLSDLILRELAANAGPQLAPRDEEVGMSRVSRPLVLTAIALALAITLAPVPAQARESAPLGWFDALAHQIQHWTASWWTWPAHVAAPAQAKGHPIVSKGWRPHIRPLCSGVPNPDGSCI
jgi:hypothetical protein